HVSRGERVARGGSRYGFAIRQQHPSGKCLTGRAPRFRRQPMRKISEAGVDVELAILVEARGMESDAALEIPVHRDPWRSCIPPVAVEILKRVAVARALDEPTR